MSVRAGASPSSNSDKALPVPSTTRHSSSSYTGASRTSSGSPSHNQQYSTPPPAGNMDHHSSNRNSTGAYGQAGHSPNLTSASLSSGNNNPNPNAARFRASVDAARSLYSGGHQSLQAGGGMAGLNMSNNAGSTAGVSPRPGSTSKRPSSEMLASFAAGNMNSESDALDKWFEDLHHYEATLEEMAAASLDQSFKEELGAIEQWFKVLSEAERTAALYSLLQTSSQVQIRFFITVLQQMARCDPMNALLSPANPQQASMEAQMDAKLASLGLKSPASPAIRQFARQSLGAMPMGDAAGFLSPSSAMLQPPPRSSSTSTSNPNDSPQSSSAHESADAAILLAAQRARLNAHAANRISAPGSLLSAYDTATSIRSPLWSQANSEQVAERASSRDGRSPSPDGRASNGHRSRPASMISDHGLPSSASNAGNMSNNLSPNLGSGEQIHMTHVENGALSPLLPNQSWASMMNTPLVSTFGQNSMGAQEGTFPRLDMSTNSNSGTNWANQSAAALAANGIVLDDAKKFRRNGRSSDQGLNNNNNNNNLNNAMNNMNLGSGNANLASQQAAMAAQQNWRNMNTNNVNPGGNMNNGGSSDLSNLANLQAAMQQINAAAASAGGGGNNMNSPQMAMANLLAAQQQIQQQMQLQQLMAGMSPMGMMNNLQQQQQMLSPVLGGMGLGMMPQSATSSSSHTSNRRSPRPSDRATMGGNLHNALSNKTLGGGIGSGGNKDSSTGSGTNPDEAIDFTLLSDIPSWLRSLRLHKYTPNFENNHWEKMIMMTNSDLELKGVAALGARRKLLKVFENVRNAQGIPHPPGSEIPGEDGKAE